MNGEGKRRMWEGRSSDRERLLELVGPAQMQYAPDVESITGKGLQQGPEITVTVSDPNGDLDKLFCRNTIEFPGGAILVTTNSESVSGALDVVSYATPGSPVPVGTKINVKCTVRDLEGHEGEGQRTLTF